ncbi:MAG: universal stress protein [Desulfobulbaceae bacterium]|nr:universal stress protein [Desulfobulbaceae bacterium]
MSEQTLHDKARRAAERHLLAAVDESDNSKRAVMYLADFFGQDKNVFITLLSIIPEPSEDYFAKEEERVAWLGEKKQFMEKVLAGYKDILLGAGFGEKQLETRLSIRKCRSIGDAILEEQERLKCCIVVVGRRGISHNEEFIFGSTSNKILHHATNCAVMVIE